MGTFDWSNVCYRILFSDFVKLQRHLYYYFIS
jgi:hypothetical protein